jgi:hypothetical protein
MTEPLRQLETRGQQPARIRFSARQVNKGIARSFNSAIVLLLQGLNESPILCSEKGSASSFF